MMKLSEDLRPLTDLKVGAGEIIGQLERTGRPIVLTRHGRGVAVMLSISAFESLQSRLADSELRAAMEEGEQDVRAGRTTSHETILARYLGAKKNG